MKTLEQLLNEIPAQMPSRTWRGRKTKAETGSWFFVNKIEKPGTSKYYPKEWVVGYGDNDDTYVEVNGDTLYEAVSKMLSLIKERQ